MSSYRSFVFSIAMMAIGGCLLPSVCSTAAGDEPAAKPANDGWTGFTQQDAPKDLAETLQNGVKLLEDKQGKKFLETYLHPADKKKLQTGGEYEKILAKFPRDEKRQARILEQFKQALKEKPGLNAEKTRAIYDLFRADHIIGPTVRKSKLRLEKIDGSWRLTDT